MSGGKYSKVRLTGLAAVDCSGERLHMFALGTLKNSGVLKALNICLLDAVLNSKARCQQNFLKIG